MERGMAGGRLGPPVYGQHPEPPLSMLLQRTQHNDLPPPSQDTQSTYFSQAPMSQVSPHPMSRWLTDPPPASAATGSARGPAAEPSQDSAVSGLSQDSVAPGAAGALRTKSAALEQRIDHERQQRRQLERDVREAVTVVAAHVQALPELWHALVPRLLAGVERAVQAEAEKAHRQAGERVSRLEHRLAGLDAAIRSAVEQGCRQSDHHVLSALHNLQQTVSEVEHRTGGAADHIMQLQSQLEEMGRSLPAAAAAASSDREAARQLTSAAREVTAAVTEVRQVTGRLAEQLATQQRLLSQQAARPPAVAAAAPPLAARASCLTSPVGTVRPLPCWTAPAAPAQRRQSGADSGGASPPAKQPRSADLPPPTPPQKGGARRQTPIAATEPHPQAEMAALPQSAARTIRATPSHGRRRPGSASRKLRELAPPPPPPPPPAPRAFQKPLPVPPAVRSGQRRQKTLYSPESEVASLTELKGCWRPPAAATPAAADVYNFTWETDEPLPWPRQSAVRTYSRTPQRTPLPSARPAASPPERIRRSVGRPCRVPSAGPPQEQGRFDALR